MEISDVHVNLSKFGDYEPEGIKWASGWFMGPPSFKQGSI